MCWGRTLWSVLRRDGGGSPESRGLCQLLSQVDRWMYPKRSDLVSVQGLGAGSGAGARRRAVGSRERGGMLLRGLPGEW